MKLKFSMAISIMLFAFFACHSIGQAQVKQIPGPTKTPPQDISLVKPGLIGTITFAASSDPKLSAFTCSDFTVAVGTDVTKNSGGLSIPSFQTVASAKALAKSASPCRYLIGAIPANKPFKIDLRVTNQKKFSSCDGVQLSYTYSPLKTLETVTFKADQIEERNFQVKSIKCTIIK